MSGHRSPYGSGRHPRSSVGTASSALASAASAWEDDAWKIDSDDEDFVRASRLNANPASPSTPAINRLTTLTNGAALKSQSAADTRQDRQPPSHQANGGTSWSVSSTGKEQQSLKEPASSGPWTMVERGAKTDNDEGLSSAPRASVDAKDSIARTSTSSSYHSPKFTRKAELTGAILDDIDDVLKDPTLTLARLDIHSKAGRSASPAARKLSDADANAASNSKQKQTGPPIASLKSPNRPTFDTTNAIVAVDGIVTNLPASSDQFDARAIDLPPGRDVVFLNETLERRRSVRSERRKAGFIKCLREEVVPMDELRTLAWAGVPDDLRPMVWMLLLGYLPPNRAIRTQSLARKRSEYASGVRNAFQRGTEELDQAIWHQIHIDVPRTNPGILLWQREATQRALERILYVWAIRHPASGYVQGINDLATPFFEVFLEMYISTDPEQYDVGLLPPAALEAIEADTFWCLSKLLDGIQDNYIFAQPGIQRQVRRMGELVSRINPTLHKHFEEQNVEYMQFAFRWMNCLLMRELSVRNIVRMWDSYLAEGPDAFSEFHLFVCAAFLDKWSDELRKMDFQGIIMFLQSLPTQNWTAKETELLLADAFVKKSLFGGTAHLTN